MPLAEIKDITVSMVNTMLVEELGTLLDLAKEGKIVAIAGVIGYHNKETRNFWINSSYIDDKALLSEVGLLSYELTENIIAAGISEEVNE